MENFFHFTTFFFIQNSTLHHSTHVHRHRIKVEKQQQQKTFLCKNIRQNLKNKRKMKAGNLIRKQLIFFSWRRLSVSTLFKCHSWLSVPVDNSIRFLSLSSSSCLSYNFFPPCFSLHLYIFYFLNPLIETKFVGKTIFIFLNWKKAIELRRGAQRWNDGKSLSPRRREKRKIW